MTTARRPLRNFSLVVLGDLVGKVAPFFASPIVLRALHPAGYGHLAYLTTLIGFGILLGSWGLVTVGIREVARKPEATTAIAGVVMLVRLALGLACVPVVVLLAHAQSVPLVPSVLYALVLPLTAIDLGWVLVARQRPVWGPASTAVGQIAYLAFVVMFVRTPSDLAWVTAGYLAISVAGVVLTWLAVLTTYGAPRPTREALGLVPLGAAFVFGLGSFMSLTYDKVDVLIVSGFRGSRETGIYAACYSMMTISITALSLGSQVVFPLMASRFDSEPARADANLRTYGRMLLVLGGLVAVLVAVFARQALRLYAGASYVSGAGILRVLSLNFLAAGFAMAFASYVLAARGDTRRYLAAVTVGAIGNLVVNLLLVPVFGAIAAAATTVGAQVAVAGTAWWLGGRDVGILRALRLRGVLAAVVASLGVSAIAHSVGAPWPAAAGLTASAYAATAVWTGALSLREIRELL